MILLVGLGNPGARYADNRHNIGFMAVDAIVRRHRFSAERSKFEGLLCEGTLSGEKVLALKPMTYMNESGRSVGQAMRFYKLTPADVIVFHDELDLAPGKLRVKTGGGNAGHNGLRSITEHIGQNFRRVRLGIGHPGNKDLVSPYVLSDFSKDDHDWLTPLLDAIADAAPDLAAKDDQSFATRVHERLTPRREPATPAKQTRPSSTED